MNQFHLLIFAGLALFLTELVISAEDAMIVLGGSMFVIGSIGSKLENNDQY